MKQGWCRPIPINTHHVMGARFWEVKARVASQEIQRLHKGQHKPCSNYPQELEPLAHDRTGRRGIARHAMGTF